MTHPLMSTQNRPYGREGALSIWHLERALLLFDCLEIRNGARAKSGNELTARMLASLDEKRIEELAEKHGLEPKGPIAVAQGRGGRLGRSLGDQPRAHLDGVHRTWASGRARTTWSTRSAGAPRARAACTADPVTLAHALVKLLYDGQHSRHRSASAQPVRMSDPINLLLGFAFEKESASLRSRAALRAARRAAEGVRTAARASAAARRIVRAHLPRGGAAAAQPRPASARGSRDAKSHRRQDLPDHQHAARSPVRPLPGADPRPPLRRHRAHDQGDDRAGQLEPARLAALLRHLRAPERRQAAHARRAPAPSTCSRPRSSCSSPTRSST